MPKLRFFCRAARHGDVLGLRRWRTRGRPIWREDLRIGTYLGRNKTARIVMMIASKSRPLGSPKGSDRKRVKRRSSQVGRHECQQNGRGSFICFSPNTLPLFTFISHYPHVYFFLQSHIPFVDLIDYVASDKPRTHSRSWSCWSRSLWTRVCIQHFLYKFPGVFQSPKARSFSFKFSMQCSKCGSFILISTLSGRKPGRPPNPPTILNLSSTSSTLVGWKPAPLWLFQCKM